MWGDTIHPIIEGTGKLLCTRNLFGSKQSDGKESEHSGRLDSSQAPTRLTGRKTAVLWDRSCLFTAVAALEGIISGKAGRAPNPYVFKESSP